MDPSLLKTKNLHEVKHWIEPGRFYNSVAILNILNLGENCPVHKILTENHFMDFGILRVNSREKAH